jgi:hypothetical protein
MGLRDRLQEVADAVGSDAELARIAGVSRSNVSQWLAGTVQSMKAISALNIQEKTGYLARWLVLGKGPKKTGEPVPDEKKNQPEADEEKLLVTIRTFLESDKHGRDAIWAGTQVALKRVTQRQRRGGSADGR